MNKNTEVNINLNISSLLKFIVPSLVGILLFMTPIMINGQFTIPVAFLSNLVVDTLESVLPLIALILISISAIGSILIKIFKTENKVLNSLFNISYSWLSARIIGMIIVIMTYFKVGPEFIWSDSTGGMILFSLLPLLTAVFLFAGLFLPLLLNHGLLEFVGALFTKVMRPLFKLPGRSSIDCITSWLGDGTIGILLTSKQYEEGFYTKKEASVIGTSFSAVSITFSLMVITQVGLSHMFVPFYLTVTFAGIVAAIVLPRVRPLSKKPDTYIDGRELEKNVDLIPNGYTPFTWGLKNAIDKAEDNFSFHSFVEDGLKNVIDMWMGVLPVVMSMGGIALMIAEYTHIFTMLGLPFIPLLKLLQVPEAVAASKTLVVGFADMFIPSVLATSIQNEMTRFIIACTSVTQLIYMSEVGGLLLGSKIPVSFKELVIIFLERTVITLPIIVLIANLLF
ncbi:YjiH family protein [Clostridium botulinum]|uniref:YjiH family protein n=1 Tax=Clostridium sp. ZBS13 TaxID=2949971 RepID=UPI0013F0B96B|nr:YjiH family protein [Clostridium sp. ZBS13]MBN1043801.1 YjiH family protein [Clostridium botulinum]NFS29497.1 YjiH family protein [Clostridium botulinum]NFS54056.1 YjiH family protein [Clostridium botulinum]NFT16765.1 YjiH family protein [Clostridium botulinum]